LTGGFLVIYKAVHKSTGFLILYRQKGKRGVSTCRVLSIVLYREHVSPGLGGNHIQRVRAVVVVNQLTLGGLRRTLAVRYQLTCNYTHLRSIRTPAGTLSKRGPQLSWPDLKIK